MSTFRQIGAHRSDAQRSTGSRNEAINNVKRSSTTSTAMRLPIPIQPSRLELRPITACTSMRNLEQAQTSSMTSRDRTSDWRSDRPALSIASSAMSQCFGARLAISCSRRSASTAQAAGKAEAALDGSTLKNELPAFSRDAIHGGRLTLAIKWPNKGWRRTVTIAKKLLWSIFFYGGAEVRLPTSLAGSPVTSVAASTLVVTIDPAPMRAACPTSTPGPTKSAQQSSTHLQS
jgi:hypothetical protein